jgi:hypothetical protein
VIFSTKVSALDLVLGDTDISTFYWSAAHQNFGRYKPSLEHLGQVEALPRIEVNVCFRVLIPESGLADFVKSFGRLEGVRKSPRKEPAGSSCRYGDLGIWRLVASSGAARWLAGCCAERPICWASRDRRMLFSRADMMPIGWPGAGWIC